MSKNSVKIGIIGCGSAARIHAGRLSRLEGVELVGLADPQREAAEALAEEIAQGTGGKPVAVYGDHLELLGGAKPSALAIFTPHRMHYQPALDALQAGCHVFVEKPLSTNPQEAMDLVRLARGRGKLVGVGHQYRLRPSLVEIRRRLHDGKIGRVRSAVAVMAAPWLASHGGADQGWRFDPKVSGGGILADAGDHLLDALLWITGRSVSEVAAFQDRLETGLDVVDAVAMKLDSGAVATLVLDGTTSANHFELTFYGDRGAMRATGSSIQTWGPDGVGAPESMDEPSESIDANFVRAVREGASLSCPAEEALETVKLQDAIARSAATGQVVRLG